MTSSRDKIIKLFKKFAEWPISTKYLTSKDEQKRLDLNIISNILFYANYLESPLCQIKDSKKQIIQSEIAALWDTIFTIKDINLNHLQGQEFETLLDYLFYFVLKESKPSRHTEFIVYLKKTNPSFLELIKLANINNIEMLLLNFSQEFKVSFLRLQHILIKPPLSLTTNKDLINKANILTVLKCFGSSLDKLHRGFPLTKDFDELRSLADSVDSGLTFALAFSKIPSILEYIENKLNFTDFTDIVTTNPVKIDSIIKLVHVHKNIQLGVPISESYRDFFDNFCKSPFPIISSRYLFKGVGIYSTLVKDRGTNKHFVKKSDGLNIFEVYSPIMETLIQRYTSVYSNDICSEEFIQDIISEDSITSKRILDGYTYKSFSQQMTDKPYKVEQKIINAFEGVKNIAEYSLVDTVRRTLFKSIQPKFNFVITKKRNVNYNPINEIPYKVSDKVYNIILKEASRLKQASVKNCVAQNSCYSEEIKGKIKTEIALLFRTDDESRESPYKTIYTFLDDIEYQNHKDTESIFAALFGPRYNVDEDNLNKIANEVCKSIQNDTKIQEAINEYANKLFSFFSKITSLEDANSGESFIIERLKFFGDAIETDINLEDKEEYYIVDTFSVDTKQQEPLPRGTTTKYAKNSKFTGNLKILLKQTVPGKVRKYGLTEANAYTIWDFIRFKREQYITDTTSKELYNKKPKNKNNIFKFHSSYKDTSAITVPSLSTLVGRAAKPVLLTTEIYSADGLTDMPNLEEITDDDTDLD